MRGHPGRGSPKRPTLPPTAFSTTAANRFANRLQPPSELLLIPPALGLVRHTDAQMDMLAD